MAAFQGMLVAAAIVSTSLAGAASVLAQDYPNKPLRVITGGSGTTPDIVMRHLGQQ
jgi:tripartite-type tricarboxylate transporter receptor subunit TctC